MKPKPFLKLGIVFILYKIKEVLHKNDLSCHQPDKCCHERILFVVVKRGFNDDQSLSRFHRLEVFNEI